MTKDWRNRIVGHGQEDPAALVPNELNWRTHPAHQRKALTEVMDRVGWVQDIIVNRRSGRLVDGHLRLTLALERGEPAVPVVYVDLAPDEEALVLATLDPLAELAEADGETLRTLHAMLEADGAIADLLEGVATSARLALDEPLLGATEPDDIPDLGHESVSQAGDLWQLGEHRLLCGDATDPADVDKLMAGRKPGWLWTDPPYGVDYQGGTAEHLTLANDRADGLGNLLEASFRAADAALGPGAALYVAHPAGPHAQLFAQTFLDAGWHLHQTLIWVKDAFVLGHSDYHYRHEPILYGWKGPKRPWYGGRDQQSVFEIPRPRRSPEHPTAKPVALVEAQLRNSSKRGQPGYDPFCGSGTTLIAAERLGRPCLAMEIDPRYVDVCLRRWQAYTGLDAILLNEGCSFRQVEEARDGR